MKQLHRVSWPAGPVVPVILCCLLAGGIGAAWFLTHFQRIPVERSVGMSAEARANPLLAAERYCRLAGRAVESHRGRDLLTSPPPAGDVLLIRSLPGSLRGSVAEKLYAWIESGGHLILPPGENVNELMTKVGAEVIESNEEDCGCPEDEGKEGDDRDPATAALAGEEGEPPQEGWFDSSDRVLVAEVKGLACAFTIAEGPLLADTAGRAQWNLRGRIERHRFNAESGETTVTADDGEGAWLLRYAIGRGSLTVVAETGMFTNTRIGERDNAYLFSILLEDGNKVWLLYSNAMESLPSLIWQRFPWLVLSMGVLLLLLLWKAQERIGLPLLPATGERRSILLHIQGIGRFHWRLDRAAVLVEGNRREVWQRLEFATGKSVEWEVASPTELEPLARKTGLAEALLEEALLRPVKSEQDLVRSTRALQQLEEALQRRRKEQHGTDA